MQCARALSHLAGRAYYFLLPAGQPCPPYWKGIDVDTIQSAPEGLQAQRDFINKLEAERFGWDILVGDAFVRGMRDIGYKSVSFALAELIDNAVQASASHVDVVFGYDGG